MFKHAEKRAHGNHFLKTRAGVEQLNRFAFAGAEIKIVFGKISGFFAAGKLNVPCIFFRAYRYIYAAGAKNRFKPEMGIKKLKLVIFAKDKAAFADNFSVLIGEPCNKNFISPAGGGKRKLHHVGT